MATREELNDLASIMRGLINAVKPPYFLNTLIRDYKEMEGECFPFKRLGYKTAEELLQAIDEFMLVRQGNELCITAKPNSKTAHISSMVRQQKSKKKPTPKKKVQYNRYISSQKRANGVSGNCYQRQQYQPQYKHPAQQRMQQLQQQQQHLQVQLLRQQQLVQQKLQQERCQQQFLEQQLQKQYLEQQQQQQCQYQQQQHQQQQYNHQQQIKDTKDLVPKEEMNLRLMQQRAEYQLLLKKQQQQIYEQNALLEKRHNEIQQLISPQRQQIAENINNKNFSNDDNNNCKMPINSKNNSEKKFAVKIAVKNEVFSPKSQQQPTTPEVQKPAVKVALQQLKTPLTPKRAVEVAINVPILKQEQLKTPGVKKHAGEFSFHACSPEQRQQPKTQTVAPNALPSAADAEIIELLYKELSEHPHGMFAKKIPDWFATKHSKPLPSHWWMLVTSASNKFFIEIGPSLQGNGYEKYILFAEKNATGAEIAAIILPWSMKYWKVLITYCAATNAVWARLLGQSYSDRFDALMSQLRSHAHMRISKQRPIVCRGIYLVFRAGAWLRVHVVELDIVKEMALCHFIDVGMTMRLANTSLYICDRKFLQLPAQALRFTLLGLEDFADYSYAQRHLDALLPNKTFTAKIVSKESDYSGRDAGGQISVVLYENCVQEEDSINALLLQQICTDFKVPELSRNGTNVVVTHINEAGVLYLRLSHSDFEFMQQLLQQLIATKFKRAQCKVNNDDFKSAKIFLICDESDVTETHWYRGALAATALEKYVLDDACDEFDIYYVDYGYTRCTHISCIFRLESLSAALCKFPRQAIKARLHNIPTMNSSILGRMRALLPADCEARVLMNTQEIVPTITIYQRLDGVDMSCSINEMLQVEYDLSRTSASADVTPTNNTLLPTPKRSSIENLMQNLSISPVLKITNLNTYEDLPPIDSKFDVVVSHATSPTNFMLQPYKDYENLHKLMDDLHSHCMRDDQFIAPNAIKVGLACAAKNAVGKYCRVIVLSISGDKVQVTNCDFGNVLTLRSDCLKPLTAKFLNLPIMAISAKLHGIAALNDAWTAGDCIRFYNITVGFKFECTLKRIKCESLNRNRILEVLLTDTTRKIDMHKMLIHERRAKSS